MLIYLGAFAVSVGIAAYGEHLRTKKNNEKGFYLCLALAVLVMLLTGKRRVTFQTNGGTALETVYVKRGGVVGQVLTPVKPGAMFDGWFSDAACTKPWDVEHDEVRGSMTLYARWR